MTNKDKIQMNPPCNFKTGFYTLAKIICARHGYNLSELSIGLGYENPTTAHTMLSRIDIKSSSASRNRIILAFREIGASNEEMKALVTAYIEQSGDASLLLSIDPVLRRRAAQRISEELCIGGLFNMPNKRSRMFNTDKIRARRKAMQARKEKLLDAARDSRWKKFHEKAGSKAEQEKTHEA